MKSIFIIMTLLVTSYASANCSLTTAQSENEVFFTEFEPPRNDR